MQSLWFLCAVILFMLTSFRLPDVIAKYSHRKPIMVFCATRKSVEATAQMLATWWPTKPPKERYWEGPRKYVAVEDKILKGSSSYHCRRLSLTFSRLRLGRSWLSSRRSWPR